MKPIHPEPPPRDVAEAIAIQQCLRAHVRIVDEVGPIRLIAGVDVGYEMQTDTAFAIAVLMDIGDLKPLAVVRAELPAVFPYVPGLLSFREIPVVIEALAKLPRTPELIMVDGQGIAHPRRLGIAAHLGVLMDIPTIGVAKSRLTGRYAPLGETPGDSSPLMDKGERIGTVLRSKKNCLPLFISAGHRVSQETALNITTRCLRGYRLPEPTRIADKFSKRALRDDLPGALISA